MAPQQAHLGMGVGGVSIIIIHPSCRSHFRQSWSSQCVSAGVIRAVSTAGTNNHTSHFRSCHSVVSICLTEPWRLRFTRADRRTSNPSWFSVGQLFMVDMSVYSKQQSQRGTNIETCCFFPARFLWYMRNPPQTCICSFRWKSYSERQTLIWNHSEWGLVQLITFKCHGVCGAGSGAGAWRGWRVPLKPNFRKKICASI